MLFLQWHHLPIAWKLQLYAIAPFDDAAVVNADAWVVADAGACVLDADASVDDVDPTADAADELVAVDALVCEAEIIK